MFEVEKDNEEKALRYNHGKPEWSLVDFDSLIELVRVLEFGKNKYSRDNWKKGLDKYEILESMQRHLIELFKDNKIDEESGRHHMGHIMANAMFYLYFDKEKDF